MHTITYVQTLLFRLANSRSGAVATEYAFLVAFIAIVGATGMVLLGTNLSTFFNDIGTALEGAGDGIPPMPGAS